MMSEIKWDGKIRNIREHLVSVKNRIIRLCGDKEMKIEDKTINQVMIKDLNGGDTFYHNDRLYIKIYGKETGVDLMDGNHVAFMATMFVRKCTNAKIVVGD